MAKNLFILNEAPYGTERSYNTNGTSHQLCRLYSAQPG